MYNSRRRYNITGPDPVLVPSPAPTPPTPPRFFFPLSPALVAALNKTWGVQHSLAASGQERGHASAAAKDQLDMRLRKDVKLLGGILGRTIEKHSGETR